MSDPHFETPVGQLEERIADLVELRARVDADLAKLRGRLHRIHAAQTASTGVVPGGLDPATVRAWGRDHGWTLGNRGRLPGDLIHAYLNRRRATE